MFPQERKNHFPDEKGQALVEFLVAFPLLLFLFLGVYQFGQIWVIKEHLSEAAYFGVLVSGEGGDGIKAAREFLEGRNPSLEMGRLKITTMGTRMWGLTLRIEYSLKPFKVFIPILGDPYPIIEQRTVQGNTHLRRTVREILRSLGIKY